ncbi:MAG TPA: NAD(P)/FAD-dependent oxidoreductase [Candidatus Dormibacteraeota bacterium]
MYDVAVAGGGPAGLAAARAAARGGASVVVLEREPAFGIPTRTSGGSFISPLRALGVPDRLWAPMHEVRFVGPTTEAVFHFDVPEVCVLDVRALYQWLATEAAAAGAELQLRTTVSGLRRENGGVTLFVRRGGGGGGPDTCSARFAVDSTGTAAVLAGATGLHPPYRRRGVGAELDLAAPAFPADVCVLAMGKALAPSGYAWAFPYSPGRVRLGVGVMRPDSDADPRALLERARCLPALRALLEDAQPIELHAGVIPAEPLRARVVSGGVVCCGDAASHASTLVGEGIRFAIGAGEAAGGALAEAVRRGDERPLASYERSWRRRHGRSFAIAYRINRRLATFDDDHWDRAVATLGSTPAWFATAALATDFRPQLLLRLLATRPRLAWSLVRAAT